MGYVLQVELSGWVWDGLGNDGQGSWKESSSKTGTSLTIGFQSTRLHGQQAIPDTLFYYRDSK